MTLYTQLIVIIFLGPFLISLWPPLKFWSYWRSLFAVIIFVSLPFLVWDIFMTNHGAWGFNPALAGSLKLLSLPIGEWLFFLVVPFVCLLMYEFLIFTDQRTKFTKVPIDRVDRHHLTTLNHQAFIHPINQANSYTQSLYKSINTTNQSKQTRNLLMVVTTISLILAVINNSQLYTFSVWLAMALASFITALINPKIICSKTFWLYLLLSFAGFMVLNSLLTSLPVVWYHSAAISNWRVGSIPIEDFLYNCSFLILCLVIWLKRDIY